MKKVYNCSFIAVLFFLTLQVSNAQGGFFYPLKPEENPLSGRSLESLSLKKYKAYRIDEAGLRTYLWEAPLENNSLGAPGVELAVPLPNGKVELFILFESPILSPEVAANHPEIKTYAGKGIEHPGYRLRINLTSEGFSAIILGVDEDAVYFEKLMKNIPGMLYKSYFVKDVIHNRTDIPNSEKNRCGVIDDGNLQMESNKLETRTPDDFTNGTQLKTFRLAMAADAEFTANKGGTQASAFAALTNYVNNLTAVYNLELSVTFTLVSDINLVYTDAATDPYNNDDQGLMLDQNQTNLDNLIGSSNYDIGHVLGYAGGSGGGVASSPSICENGFKGQGVSGVGDGSYPEVFDFQLIAHEVGHQFGMSHSYNSNVPVCTTREYATSVEPGAGTTIMSYGYTCTNTDPGSGLVGADDYEYPQYGPFLNFHVVNINQAINTMNNQNCYGTSSTTNSIPVINAMQTSFTIPKLTPFSLIGSATDADSGDDLSYSWEGTNISDEPNNNNLTATTISDPTRPPFFRSYPPILASSNSTPGLRYFPRYSAILDGTNYAKGDKLPSIGIVTSHTLTVRDQNGGIATKDVTVSIDGNSGPFLITNDPTGSKQVGSMLSVTWSVNNTNNAPVNCSLVDILLSIDGGYTFPITLGSSLPNTGTATITIPNNPTTQARLKIRPSSSNSNIFFDISNQNFTIDQPLPVTWLSFDAFLKNQNSVLLTWALSMELNCIGYEIEMSMDGNHFSKIGFVKSNPSNFTNNNYQHTIYDLSEGIYYFRLKQLDTNGSYSYSNLERVQVKFDSKPVSIFPNPTSDHVKIDPGSYQDQFLAIRIVDQMGKEVLRLPAKRYSSFEEINISNLVCGAYQFIVIGKNFTAIHRLIKM
ncbi:MAG: zinc-dependent metalloprotease [Saprospiraceae bacterium]|nr:zinc-dependent metalloprotease [Saprospiraceae bacterium]